MSDDMYTEIHDTVRTAVSETQAPSADDAAYAAAEYAAYVADGNVDRILALGLPVGAIPDGETLARFRGMLAGFPPEAQPRGWRSFNDLQILRWGFASSRLARWESVVLENIEAVYFPAGEVSEELKRLWKMNPPPGYESSGDAMALFQMPELRQRAQRGEVASLLVSFPVQIERGDRWLITVHLAEYQPGKWYPVAHRQDVATSVRPFSADRAPRPN